MEVVERVKRMRSVVDSRKFFNERCDKTIRKLRKRKRKIERQIIDIDISIRFVNDVALSRRRKVKKYFEELIGDALRLIYQQEFSVSLEYGMKYRRSVLTIKVIITHEDGYRVERDMSSDGYGGGIHDMVALSFRILVMSLISSVDNVLILDEAFKFLDGKRVLRVGEFLRFISHQMGIQIVLNTHHHALKDYADASIGLELGRGGVTRIAG